MDWIAGFIGIYDAILANDSWALSEAFGHPAVWPFGLVGMLLVSFGVQWTYKRIPRIERYLESSLMTVCYLSIAGIIFVEVFRRFVLQQQAPWSTTLPPFLFLVMTWIGCSYNVKLRSHLAFVELRMSLSRGLQMCCLMLDSILWLGFSWVVVVASSRVVANSAANFQIMPGTNDVMQWWFLLSLPIGFAMLGARVLENLFEDIRRYKNDEPLIKIAIIGGE